jgi:hypothetical protein
MLKAAVCQRDHRRGPSRGLLDGAGYHGFLLDQGNYTALDARGPFTTVANRIKSSGQIVGEYYEDRGPAIARANLSQVPHGALIGQTVHA